MITETEILSLIGYALAPDEWKKGVGTSTPGERMLAHAERIGPPKEVDTSRIDFVEEPSQNLGWEESFFSDSRDRKDQKPAIQESFWDPMRRGHQSWQS